MKNVPLILLTSAAIGVATIGSASAMPFGNAAAALDNNQVENIRIVCDQYRRCYDTRQTRRVVRPNVASRYYDGHAYYAEPSYGYAPGYAYGGPRRYYDQGYNSGPGVGIGIGPFGFSAW